MADVNPITSVFGIIWGAWLALMTALDPTTINNPIACTLASLVFGVIFYVILTIALSKITEGHNLEESLIKWVNFLVTVGFTLLMIQQGFVYLIASMMSLMVFMIVIIFGLLFFYYIYAHGKKFAKGAYEISKSARFLKDALRERREEKMEEAEIRIEENKDIEETKRLLDEVEKECDYYKALEVYLQKLFKTFGTLGWRKVYGAYRKTISNYLADVKSKLTHYQSQEFRDMEIVKVAGEKLQDLLDREIKAIEKQLDDLRKVISRFNKSRKNYWSKKIAEYESELKRQIAPSKALIEDRLNEVEKKVTKTLKKKQRLIRELIKLLDIKLLGSRRSVIISTVEDLRKTCVKLYNLLRRELADESRDFYITRDLDKLINAINADIPKIMKDSGSSSEKVKITATVTRDKKGNEQVSIKVPGNRNAVIDDATLRGVSDTLAGVIQDYESKGKKKEANGLKKAKSVVDNIIRNKERITKAQLEKRLKSASKLIVIRSR